VGCTEQRHQRTGWSIHVQDASGWRKHDHAWVGGREEGLCHHVYGLGGCLLWSCDIILRGAGLVL